MAINFILQLIQRVLRKVLSASPTNSHEELAENVMKEIGRTFKNPKEFAPYHEIVGQVIADRNYFERFFAGRPVSGIHPIIERVFGPGPYTVEQRSMYPSLNVKNPNTPKHKYHIGKVSGTGQSGQRDDLVSNDAMNSNRNVGFKVPDQAKQIVSPILVPGELNANLETVIDPENRPDESIEIQLGAVKSHKNSQFPQSHLDSNSQSNSTANQQEHPFIAEGPISNSTNRNKEIDELPPLIRLDQQPLKLAEKMYPGMAYRENVHEVWPSEAIEQATKKYPDLPKQIADSQMLPPDSPEDLLDEDYFFLPDNPTFKDQYRHSVWKEKKYGKL
jgi:hypothetical protein